MAEIREVLYLTRGVTGPVIRAGMDDLPACIFQFRNLRHGIDRVGHGNPDEAISFHASVGGGTRLGGNMQAVRLGNQHTGPLCIIPPAMIWTYDTVICDGPEGKGGPPVYT